jgi:hypothetical protein
VGGSDCPKRICANSIDQCAGLGSRGPHRVLMSGPVRELCIWYSLFQRNRRNLRPSSADQTQAPVAESLRLPPASKDGSHDQQSQ